MLKISAKYFSQNDIVLLLEGRLEEHDVEHLKGLCEIVLEQRRGLTLDLRLVGSGCERGIDLLCDLQRRHARLVNCRRSLAARLRW